MNWSIVAVAGAINIIRMILGRNSILGKGYNSNKKGIDSCLDLLGLTAACSDLNIQKVWLVSWFVGVWGFFAPVFNRETWRSSYASILRGALEDLSHLKCL